MYEVYAHGGTQVRRWEEVATTVETEETAKKIVV